MTLLSWLCAAKYIGNSVGPKYILYEHSHMEPCGLMVSGIRCLLAFAVWGHELHVLAASGIHFAGAPFVVLLSWRWS